MLRIFTFLYEKEKFSFLARLLMMLLLTAVTHFLGRLCRNVSSFSSLLGRTRCEEREMKSFIISIYEVERREKVIFPETYKSSKKKLLNNIIISKAWESEMSTKKRMQNIFTWVGSLNEEKKDEKKCQGCYKRERKKYFQEFNRVSLFFFQAFFFFVEGEKFFLVGERSSSTRIARDHTVYLSRG